MGTYIYVCFALLEIKLPAETREFYHMLVETKLNTLQVEDTRWADFFPNAWSSCVADENWTLRMIVTIIFNTDYEDEYQYCAYVKS